MIDLLNSIVQAISSVFVFIINMFKAFIAFITSIPEYIDFITATLAVLPPYLLPFATLGISITVIAMLIRHEII